MGVLKACTPKAEVLSGHLKDTVFAADFGHLIAGKAHRVYSDAPRFFSST